MTAATTPTATQAKRPTVGVDLRALVPETTGIGVATIEMLSALARRGNFSFVGLAHAEIPDGRLAAAGGIRCEVEPAALGVVWQQLRLPARLKRGGIDLLWSPLMTLPWRLPGPNGPTPAVVTIHDLTPLLFPEMHHWKVRWSVRPFLGRSTRLAAAIAVDSDATRRDLNKRFPECRPRTEVVPMGVSDRFRPGSADEVAAIRGEFDCPDGYILHVGTLEPRKNLDRLLDAWSEVRRTRVGSTPPLLLAGGSGWHSEQLAGRIKSMRDQDVRYLGRVEWDRLPALYRGASGFAFPSLYEGFGLPPLEAMASGVPVAVSNRSSIPEVVGDDGLLFDPESRESISAALEQLLTDDSGNRERVERALVRARTFTWDRAADAMETLFERALSLQSARERPTGR